MTTQTDPPSPRRLQRARDSGDYPRSALLERGLIWATALCGIPYAARSLWTYGEVHLKRAIEYSRAPAQDLGSLAARELLHVMALSLPLLVIVFVAHVTVRFAESRGSMLARVARGRRIAQLRHIWSARSVTSLGLQWVTFVLLVCYAWFWLRSNAASVAATIGKSLQGRELASLAALHFAWAGCLLWCTWGLVDLMLAHREWLQRMGMTRTEKQREQQEHGANPWLAQQRLERHRDVWTGSTLHLVHDATLVIHARFEIVVLLRYTQEKDKAPHILGVAVGALATRCINSATDLGIAVIEDEPLVSALARCKTDAMIPESLYAAVADLLARLPEFASPSLDSKLTPGLLRI